MTATIYKFPPPRGYSLWGSCDMDGLPIWFVDLADVDGIVHDQWQFNTKVAAQSFVEARQGRR